MKTTVRRQGTARILTMLAISLTLAIAGVPQIRPESETLRLEPLSGDLQTRADGALPWIQSLSGVLQFQPLTAAAEELPVTSIPHFADRFYLRNLAPELQRDTAAVYQGIDKALACDTDTSVPVLPRQH